MIVRANTGDELYVSLFNKANTLLGYTTEEQKIHNIAEYFAEFGNIIEACEQADPITRKVDPIYLILPADEDFFEIDANKRLITVPAIFQKNGASVVGDETAEILYFTIDRYFDVMDFANPNMKIEIQAKLPDGEEILYKAYNITAEFPRQEGKLVFGWPLDSKATRLKGNIQFSIRFFIDEDSQLQYSFNTLTTQIKINDSLNFDVTDTSIDVIDKTNMIRNRIKNSPLPLSKEAAEPEFAKLIVNENKVIKNPEGKQGIIEKDNRLFAKALFTDEALKDKQRGIDLKYIWKFAPFGSSEYTTIQYIDAENPENNNPRTDFFLTADLTYNDNDRYYYGEDKELYNGDQTQWDEKKSQLFEKFSSIEKGAAGSYVVRATNIAGRGSSKDSKPTYYIIPGAAQIICDEIDEYNNMLPEIGPTHIQYSIKKANPEDEKSDIGQVFITWFKDGEELGTFEYTGQETYDANEEGNYTFIALNRLNETETNGIESGACRVTYPASAIKANIPTIQDMENYELSFDENVLETPARSDENGLTYQWQIKSGDIYNDIEGATDRTYIALESGYYHCKITNTYNHSSKLGYTTDAGVIIS